jgi:hypothetical protein
MPGQSSRRSRSRSRRFVRKSVILDGPPILPIPWFSVAAGGGLRLADRRPRVLVLEGSGIEDVILLSSGCHHIMVH